MSGVLVGQGLRFQPDATCRCGAGNMALIHHADCPGLGSVNRCVPVWDEAKPRSPVIVSKTGAPLLSRARLKRRKPRKGRVLLDDPEHTLVMTFYFSRPVNIARWKLIKAPPGWKKCPTDAKAQNTYRSVRFRCNNLAHTLTPDAVQELRAMLCMSLEESF